MPGITTDYLEALGKQVFIKETILNGMFPCQSDITKMLRTKKVNWDFHEFYEYRMLLANSNTGGSLNSQLFKETGSLQKPGHIDTGIFKATYGTVSDGFDIDMIANIETKSARAAFITDYARRLHSMRMNVASIFKNVAINGRFGVIHRITDEDAIAAGTPTVGTRFTLEVPSNVYASGFMHGRLIIKTTGMEPWSEANCNEIYRIIDNQPHRLTLEAVNGSTPTAWAAGQYLELSDNRTLNPGSSVGFDATGAWVGTGTYTSGDKAGTGFMEGLADLFPWHIDGAFNRIGLNRPFRGQPNRQTYTTQMAGGFYMQGPNESIIDAILSGVRLATLAVPYEEIGVWMNHDTRLGIGAQEADSVSVFRQINIAQPVIYQRGVTATSYQVGSKIIPDVISDDNLPTDTIIIAPKNDLSYCTLDNAFMKIDDFIQQNYDKKAPPAPDKIDVPEEFVTSMNIGKRFIVGTPTMADGRVADGAFVHPGNTVPVAYHEMGSLFTENPFAYTVVKLRKQIVNPAECANW